MPGGGELEPKDSRKVVGTKGDPDKSWHDQETSDTEPGEYEPADSRNVTGQASSVPDRWQNKQKRPPLANGDAPPHDEREDQTERD